MEAKQILEQVRQFFNELTAPAAAAAAPAPAMPAGTEYELKDGGKVTIDKLEVGGVVLIDGAPALPGDTELTDGTKLTIGDNGVITAIEPAGNPAMPEEPAAQEDMGAKFSAFESATNEKFAAYETKFAEYEAKLSKATEMIEKLLQFGQLMVDKPAGQPDPVVKGAGTFKAEKKEKSYDILFS